MSEIRITSAQLRAKREELEQMNQRFQEAVRRLESTVQTLNGSWEGEAHDTFYNAFNKDRGQMALFSETVRKYAGVLEAIIAKYECAEQSTLSIAQSRRG